MNQAINKGKEKRAVQFDQYLLHAKWGLEDALATLNNDADAYQADGWDVATMRANLTEMLNKIKRI